MASLIPSRPSRTWRLRNPRNDDGEPLTAEETRKLNFLAAVEQAEAEAVFKLHQIVIEGAQHDPRLALQMLQLRRPADYNPPQKAEVSGAGGGAIVINMTWGDGGDSA